MSIPSKEYTIPIDLSIIVTQKNGYPAIELRRVTIEPEIIKAIVSAAYHNRPMIMVPKFTNSLQSLRSLIDKGILYQEDGQYFFTF